MGRLIDADELLTHIEDFGEGQYSLNLIDPYYVRNAPTVEAISKADYETRLKADMVAMLTEIQLEIEESENCGKAFHLGLQMASNIIQQKINELKGENNGSNTETD